MSRNRKDPHKAKLRRDRVRREKQAARAAPGGPPARTGNPFVDQPFLMERSQREIGALLEGQEFESLDEVNARMQELTAAGKVSEKASAWKADDPKWRAQQLAYDAMEKENLQDSLTLAREALKLDPNCTDAAQLVVCLTLETPAEKLSAMREIVKAAEEEMGAQFIEETTGHFWAEVSTRPYMRALQYLGQLYEEVGENEESIAVFERMLKLNEADNQSARDDLVRQYLKAGRLEKLNALLGVYAELETFSATFAWARVMERWLSGNPGEAEAALQRAHEQNPFVLPYAAGRRAIPRNAPSYFKPGEQSEAEITATALAPAWAAHPAFGEWVRGQKPALPRA